MIIPINQYAEDTRQRSVFVGVSRVALLHGLTCAEQLITFTFAELAGM